MHDVDGVRRVVGVVLDDQVDLAPEHAAVRVDVVEERLRGGSDLAIAGRRRPGQRLMGAERDAGRCHPRSGAAAAAAPLRPPRAAAADDCSRRPAPRAPPRPPRPRGAGTSSEKSPCATPPEVGPDWPTGTARAELFRYILPQRFQILSPLRGVAIAADRNQPAAPMESRAGKRGSAPATASREGGASGDRLPGRGVRGSDRAVSGGPAGRSDRGGARARRGPGDHLSLVRLARALLGRGDRRRARAAGRPQAARRCRRRGGRGLLEVFDRINRALSQLDRAAAAPRAGARPARCGC